MMSAFLLDWVCYRFSRRTLYIACFVVSGISIASIELLAASFYGLAMARIAMGLAAGFIIILGEAWVNEIAHNAYRGRVVALYTTCFTVFQLLGPGMVALLGTQRPQVVGVVVAGHLLALAAISMGLPRQRSGHGLAPAFSVLGFVWAYPALCVGVLFFAFFDSVILSMFPVYAADQGYEVKLAALMVTVILLGDAALQIPLGWLSDQLPRPFLYLGCGALSLLIGVCLPWLMGAGPVLWFILAVLGAVAGGVYTLAIILIGERFSGADLITANASAGLLWGIGSLLGPLVSAMLMTSSTQGLPIALSGAAALFLAAAWPILKRHRRPPGP